MLGSEHPSTPLRVTEFFFLALLKKTSVSLSEDEDCPAPSTHFDGVYPAEGGAQRDDVCSSFKLG